MTAASPALSVHERPELAEKALSWPERAQAVVVDSDPAFEEAGALLRAIKSLRGEIEEHHKPIIAAALASHRAALAARKRLDEPLDQAEREIKRRMAAYHEERERVAREEQRRLEAEARAREEEERLAEAAALEAEGRVEEAERVLEEEPAVLPVAAPSPAPKAAGVSMRKTWTAEVVDLGALVRAIAKGEAPLSYVSANQTALNGVAKALGAEMRVPGVRAVPRTDVAASGR